jgi:hypothetical protein
VSAGDSRGDSPARGRDGQVRRTLLRYWTPLWLLGLALLLGALAFALYPDDPPTAPQYAVQGIGVVANFTPSAIVVYQTPDPQRDGFNLAVELHAAGRPPPTGSVKIVLPRQAWGSKVACPPPAAECLPDTAGLKEAYYRLTMPWTDAGPSEPAADRNELHLSITVSHVGSNLSRNDEFISVLTPPITFQVIGHSTNSAVLTVFSEAVPGGDAYSWTTGSVPVYVNGFERWSAPSATSIEAAATPTLDSGSDLAVADKNGNLQFIAGILVGAAGGALVGAVQEWLNRRRKEAQVGADPA